MPDNPWPPTRIRKLRSTLGWTQQQCAVAVGVSLPTWSRWETGAYAPTQYRTVTALADLEQQAAGSTDATQ